MKPLLLIAAMLAMFACAGADETVTTHDEHPDVFVPGQEGRIDGSVWEDGLFNSPEAKTEFCTDYPDAWFCNEIGTAEQAWTSVEYHGLAEGVGETCYGPASPSNGDCLFPAKKKFRLIVQTTGCFVGQPPPDGPSTLLEQAMLDGVRNAALQWDNAGGIDVCVSGAPGCSGSAFMPVTIDCQYTDEPGGFAAGGLDGVVSTAVGNAPVGPHSGKDVDDFRTIAGGVININVPVIWDAVKACYPNPTESNVKSWVTYTGKHEFGHVLGFAHMGNATLMNPFRPSGCTPQSPIHTSFHDALSQYNPTSSGLTLNAGQLWAQSPL